MFILVTDNVYSLVFNTVVSSRHYYLIKYTQVLIESTFMYYFKILLKTRHERKVNAIIF